MSKATLIAVVLCVVTAAIGWRFMDKPYRLSAVGYPADQAALDHRDSAYSSITWVASEADNYLQLRFFDRVEGGVCLKPSWSDLISLAKTKSSLAHLVPLNNVDHNLTPGDMWPNSWKPDPGTLSNSAYVRLFPVGVLLNDQLIASANGDINAVAPHIMVVGLGSGIGIATLAHHFPNAAITVVDIDATVIAMVRAHFPLLNWLGTQTLANGEPRLRFIARDARQYIRYDATREKPYDLVVLDAYTSGSTIPPHLMTREFFAEISHILGNSGMIMANVIGNITNSADTYGDKSLVLGGAIRSMRAAGLSNAWCFPILTLGEKPSDMVTSRGRNNILIASKGRLDPRYLANAWARLDGFTLYPELSVGTYTTSSCYLAEVVNENGRAWTKRTASSTVSAKRLTSIESDYQNKKSSLISHFLGTYSYCSDSTLVLQATRSVNQSITHPDQSPLLGWDEHELGGLSIIRVDTDWLVAARETLRASVIAARDASKWSGEALTGDVEQGERPTISDPTWLIPDAPLFTDQRPNADIYNH